MAATSFTPSYIGGLNAPANPPAAGGADYELFLRTFSGEVLATLRAMMVTEGRFTRKTVPPGANRVQFRQIGTGTAYRHIQGANILEDNDPSDSAALLSSINMGDHDVYLDRPIIAATLVDDWENVRASIDARQPIARELGKDLAIAIDKDRLHLVIKAAEGNLLSSHKNDISGWPSSGTVVTDANALTDGSALLDALRQIEEGFSTANVPDEGRHVALGPVAYNLLVQNQDLLNRDFNTDNGVFSDGTVFRAWGMALHKTTQVPTMAAAGTNPLGTGGVNGETYAQSASNGVAICWQEMGCVTAEASAINVQSEFRTERQAEFVLAKATVGHDILRPDFCGFVKTA